MGSFHPLLPRAHFGAGVLPRGSPLAHGEVAGSGFGVTALLCADVDMGIWMGVFVLPQGLREG